MDYNNDGYKDLLVGDSNGNNWLFQGGSDGLAQGVHIEANNSSIKLPHFGSPFLIDMNNDGYLDFLFGGYIGSATSGVIQLYLNRGSNPNKLQYSTCTTLSFWKKFRSTQEAHDLDMDGDYDLIMGNANGNVYFAENTGTASNPVFSKYIMLTCQGSPIDAGTYSRETVTDWNEDGVPDLIVGGLTGSSPTFYRKLQVYLGIAVSNQDEENGTILDQCSFAVSGSPTKNIVALDFQLSKPDNAKVTIIDCFGRVAGSYNWILPEGHSLMSTDISANQPGLYFVVAEIADRIFTDRVMLIR